MRKKKHVGKNSRAGFLGLQSHPFLRIGFLVSIHVFLAEISGCAIVSIVVAICVLLSKDMLTLSTVGGVLLWLARQHAGRKEKVHAGCRDRYLELCSPRKQSKKGEEEQED